LGEVERPDPRLLQFLANSMSFAFVSAIPIAEPNTTAKHVSVC